MYSFRALSSPLETTLTIGDETGGLFRHGDAVSSLLEKDEFHFEGLLILREHSHLIAPGKAVNKVFSTGLFPDIGKVHIDDAFFAHIAPC